MMWLRSFTTLILCGALVACGEPPPAPETASETAAVEQVIPAATPRAANVDGARIAAADAEPGNWMTHGRTYSEQRFSPLEQIGRGNVADLGLAWSYDLGSTRGVEATPIVVEGVMYVTASWSIVHALDAATGELLWKYDPKVPGDWGRYACCDVVNRGVAVWKGSVFVAALDGRLISLDAATGKVNWEVLTIDKTRPYTITGAPRIMKDKVVIGNGGAELGVRGYVTAYDTATGEQVWRFYTVPGDPSLPFEHAEMKVAAETWNGEWWKVGGGGTAWDAMAYDPDLDLLYVGTGNGSPWARHLRSPGGGDNLYLSSILALRPDTGELIWHYQTTPSDNWDYTAAQHIILADLQIDGRLRKVAMQAPKNGFFYVLDRATGELISATPYVGVTWAHGIDLKTGRPIETDLADYRGDMRNIQPGPLGGHNWHPMSFNPSTGLVYVPTHDIPFWYADAEESRYRPGIWNVGLDFNRLIDHTVANPPEPIAALLAWDPIAKKVAWRQPLEGPWNGGTLSTGGGLVFQGSGDGGFRAFDAATGEVLWEVESQTGIVAGPVSYNAGGQQHVAVAAGWGGGVIAGGFDPTAAIANYHNTGRVLAFRIGAHATMPTNATRDLTIPAPPALHSTPEQIEVGKTLYNTYCMACHGMAVASSWLVPDLRYTSPERHAAFEEIVLRGSLRGNGMPDFDAYMKPEELTPLRAYIVSQAQAAYEAQQEPQD
jgi:PQQ-dependent dehydrogenase (methanol/ethanol family)